MASRIRQVQYFHTTVRDEPGEGYRLLSRLAEEQINLLAFSAVPVGPADTQFTLFPEQPTQLTAMAQRVGLSLTGPHPALLVQGNDELGRFAEVHQALAQSNVNVFASVGVTDGKGDYGCVLYVRPEEFEAAAKALGA